MDQLPEFPGRSFPGGGECSRDGYFFRKFDLATPASGIDSAIGISASGLEIDSNADYIITAFITVRRAYAANGSELRYYPTNDLTNYKVITRNLISQNSFTIPLLAGGGALPRELGDKTVTYYGSMIEFYQSKQGVGRWGFPNVYSPPNRAWYFDTNFVTTPPPACS